MKNKMMNVCKYEDGSKSVSVESITIYFDFFKVLLADHIELMVNGKDKGVAVISGDDAVAFISAAKRL